MCLCGKNTPTQTQGHAFEIYWFTFNVELYYIIWVKNISRSPTTASAEGLSGFPTFTVIILKYGVRRVINNNKCTYAWKNKNCLKCVKPVLKINSESRTTETYLYKQLQVDQWQP